MQLTDLLHPLAVLAGLVSRLVPGRSHRLVVPAALGAVVIAALLALFVDFRLRVGGFDA